MPPNNDHDLSALGKARERLYAPKEVLPPHFSDFSQHKDSSVSNAWKDRFRLSPLGAPHHIRFASRFFFIAIGFFVIAIGVSAFFLYTGKNAVSVENIELTIQGPTTIAGGDIVPLSIIVTNKNQTAIENVILEVDFPEGTRSATDLSVAYPRFSADLGSLPAGATVEQPVSAVLFGGEGSQQIIQVRVLFGTARSNSIFVKPVVYPVVISTTPLSVSVESISETVSGQSFTIRATVRSNATQPIEGIVLQAQYPSGYLLTDSSIVPVGTNFPIGALKPGASKTVTLTGTLTGQNNDLRIFHFTVGTAKSANDPSLGVAYMTQEATVTITAPFLATSFTVNGSSVATPAVASDSPIQIGMTWTNALAVPLANVEINITISGVALDPTSVRAGRAFYRSADRTIIFSRDTDSSLASLLPGASGLGSFSFSAIASPPRNSAIILTVSIAGQRLAESGVPEQITASASKTINLVSGITTFTASSLHSSGPIVNSGPIPPQADQTTSYTVVWNLVNTGNDLAGGVITAILPPYITFSNITVPSDGSITYDPALHRVTWQAGDISNGTSRTGAFQVLFMPSTHQRNSTPILTRPPVFSAFDRYAQVEVTTTGQSATTETPGDPGYTFSKAIVQ